MSDHQLILYIDELMNFQESPKLIKSLDIENLKNLQKIIEKNFDFQENSEITKPIALIIFCLTISM